jgi:hypothetical protein
VKPDATPVTITWIGRGVSFITVIISMLIGLFWDEGLTDLGRVQFGISMQCIPAFFVGLFAWGPSDCHPWSLAIGGLVGFVLTFSLYFGYLKQNPNGTPMDSGVTATFCNCVAVLICEVLRRLYTQSWMRTAAEAEEMDAFTKSIDNASVAFQQPKADVEETEENISFMNRPQWDKPKLSRFGERPLTPKLVWKAMEGTREPLTNPALVFLLFILITLTVPLVPEGDPPLENGSFLYLPATTMGIPWWAMKMIVISIVSTLVVLVMIWRMPNEFAVTSLDPDIANLLPKEMDQRKRYDETNVAVKERRVSIRESIALIKEKEAVAVDYRDRRRVSQLMLGLQLEGFAEDDDDQAGKEAGYDAGVEQAVEEPVEGVEVTP